MTYFLRFIWLVWIAACVVVVLWGLRELYRLARRVVLHGVNHAGRPRLRPAPTPWKPKEPTVPCWQFWHSGSGFLGGFLAGSLLCLILIYLLFTLFGW